MDSATWFITGTSSGIGRSLAEAVLGRGNRVAATARDAAALADLRAEYADTLSVHTLDVTRPKEIELAVTQAMAAHGRIDVVVNNAGYGLIGPVEEMTDRQIRRQVETNFLGPVRVTKAFLPHLRRQGSGRIIQVSSAGGQRAAPLYSMYHATKWALEAFSEALAPEVEAFGIGIMIVEPGGCRTNWRKAVDATRPIAAYAGTPVEDYRQRYEQNPSPGDPAKMATAIIDAAENDLLPRRLVLGTDSYLYIRNALRTRLAEVEAQVDTAPLTDADGAILPPELTA